MELPTISNYGEYSGNGNYGAHSLLVDVGPLRVWYSYQTPVAFHVGGQRRVVRRNEWGTTTGKHLNWIDGGEKAQRAERVNTATFQRLWDEQVAPLLTAGAAV